MADPRRFLRLVLAITATGIAVPALVAPGIGLTWLLFVGSSVHVASTAALFTFADVRRHARANPARFVAVPLALTATAAALAALLPTKALTTFLLGFYGWQLWHYQQQNLGLAALAARATCRPPLTKTDRRCIRAAAAAGILALLAHPQVTQLVPTRLPSTASSAATAVAWLLMIAALTTTPARTGRPTANDAVRLLAVAFPLPLLLTASPYAALGGMTLAHGLQYLLLVGMVLGGPRRRPKLPETALLLTGVLAVAGALATASHLHHGPPATRAVFGVYAGIVMTHFVLDAGLWRLRDPFPRQWLGQRLPTLIYPAGDTPVSDIESVPWPRPTPPTSWSSPASPKDRSTATR